VYHVYKRFEIALPVSTAGLNRTGTQIGKDEVLPADLAIFKIRKDQHVGIMLNGVEFIHASKSRGVAVDRLDSKYWKKSLTGFRRVI
jgi:probable lipoprotein NlpC